VSVPRPRWTAPFAAVCPLLVARALATQVTGTVDLGVSTVRYDDFLPSGAASVSPAFVLERPRGTLSARGTYLVFESGNTNLQGSVAGSAFLSSAGRWRGEVWGSGGGSRYAEFVSFWHALGGVRVHLLRGGASAWLDASAGRTSYGHRPRPVAALAAGLWTRRLGPMLTLSASHSRVGDTAYTDIGTLARGSRASFEFEGALAARLWSRGGGRGVFGEASAVFALSQRAGIVIAGGRYPTDPIRGSIAGRYLTAGLRLRTLLPRRTPPPPVVPMPVYATAGSSGFSPHTATWLEIGPTTDGPLLLVVHASHARSVEVTGDFTDWQPVALERAGPTRWQTTLAISSGLHRINVRLDGGPWIVPGGTTRAADDYDGEIGIIVVP
jgi:hypothetical protein